MNSTLEALLRQNFLSFAHMAIRELEGSKLGHHPYLGYLARELELFDPQQIEGTIESFHGVVMSRLNDHKAGRVLIVAHRVHEHDLSADLLQSRKWTHVVLPLIATRDQIYTTTAGEWCRRAGDILRPD